MAPRQPQDVSDHESASGAESTSDSASAISEPAHLLNEVSQEAGPGEVEEEFHTDESDASGLSDEAEQGSDEDEENDEDDEDEDDALPPGAPLLPPELLEPLPSPAYSMANPISTPWEQMTPKQKKAQRSRSRQSKQRVWDRVKGDAKGSGVLEAGRVAQIKRGVVSRRDRVVSGRVGKKARPLVSGRQLLLESRKRAVQEEGRELMRPAKRAKTMRKG